MAIIYLIRHAQADYPRTRLYGFLPVPLSAEGKRQAAGLAKFARGQGIDRVVASPLRRTQETAKIIAANLPGQPAVQKDPRLTEWKLGKVWQGMTWAEVVRQHPRQAAMVVSHPERVTLGERLSEAGKRVKEAIEELAETYPEDRIVVVSHGDPIRAFWNIALKRPMWRVRSLRVPRASILRLEYDSRANLLAISRINANKSSLHSLPKSVK